MVGPGGLPETGLTLFRPCGLRAMGARWQMLRWSHLVVLPTSTMSRPIGRTKARVDTRKLAAKDGLFKAFAAIFSRCLYVIEDVEAECWRERIAIALFPGSRRPLRFRWVVSGSLSRQSGRLCRFVRSGQSALWSATSHRCELELLLR